MDNFEITPRKIISVVVGVMLILLTIFSGFFMFENVDAKNVMVVQSLFTGELTWHTEPGVKWQGFGKVTHYPRRSQFWFSDKNDQGKKDDESIGIRFNDGGHAKISGGISYEMPLDEAHLSLLHKEFGSADAIEHQLVRPAIEKVIYMTGPLMSATESYASRRAELLSFIEDQAQSGVYKSKTIQRMEKDPITKLDKAVTIVEILLDKDGTPKRSDDAPMTKYGIKVFNLSINKIPYEGKVEQQIQEQQQATMAIQIQIAKAKEAEQKTLTTIEEGKAKAKLAEWEQKAIAAKQEGEADWKKKVAETEAAQKKSVAETKADQEKKVAETEAEQKYAVAKLEAKAAEEKKRADIALGEGESKRRQLVMEADGALEKKLDAYVTVNKHYADALGKYQGQIVPSIIMGGGNAGAGAQGQGVNAMDFMNLLSMKAARDLSLEIHPQKIGVKVKAP